MVKKNIDLENLVLKIQESNDLSEIWTLFLEIFDINTIKNDSFLIIKNPFKFKKLYVKDHSINIVDLKEEHIPTKNTPLKHDGYLFDKKENKFSGYWNLSFSEIEFSIITDNYENIERFRAYEFHKLIISFFVKHLNLVLHIDHLNMHTIKDDLTLLYNQNYLKSFIQREINRSKRYNLKFSVIFFDLDHLKEINDKHGHLIGTEVLKEVSRILKDSIRNIDVVARFGGDEFVIVLSDSPTEIALRISNRLRNLIKNNSFLSKEGLNLKVSGCFGISHFPKHGESVNELIKKADMAMYEVKRSGKDGILVYQGD